MILNAYAVLDAFTSLLRLFLGILVVSMALPAWWKWKASLPAERRHFLEDRSYFLFLLAILLLILNLVSWPLFYLLLQSYVPEWPGVMCIYGVTQIGTGSVGPSRFLPDLLITLQVIKPALVFLTGTWFVLYWVNRHTTTAPLMSRVLLLLLLLGFVAIVDSIVEAAYLVIPKKEEFASSGCCTDAFGVQSRSSKLLSEGLLGENYRPWLSGAYYLVNAGMSLAVAGYALLPRWRQSGACLVPLGLGALVSLAVNFAFLIEIAAPALLHSPYHHCPYDLVPLVPESVVAIALFVVGCFSAGWACLAVWLGSCPETKPFLGQEITKLVYLALFGYAGSVAMLWLELRLA